MAVDVTVLIIIIQVNCVIERANKDRNRWKERFES